jgi:hypothetical protein
MMPFDAMNFRPFFSTLSSRVIDFSSSCGTSGVWQCRTCVQRPALPGLLSIVPGGGAVANAARHLAGKVLLPRVAPIGLQLVQTFIAGKVLGLPKSY